MGDEEEAKSLNPQSSLDGLKAKIEKPEEVRKLEAKVPELEAELESLEHEEAKYVLVDDDPSSLSDEQLKARVELLDEQSEQAKQRVETDRRAVKLGYLKRANQARRCAHLKNNGEPCRAPAMGNREFCVFTPALTIAKPIRRSRSDSGRPLQHSAGSEADHGTGPQRQNSAARCHTPSARHANR